MDTTLVNRIPLFDGIPSRKHEALAALGDVVEVPAGTRLVREGALAHEFYVLVEGEAAVESDGARVGLLGPGDFFGEIGQLHDPRRTAGVVATTDAKLLVLHRRAFRSMLAQHPLVTERVLSAVTARLARAAERSA